MCHRLGICFHCSRPSLGLWACHPNPPQYPLQRLTVPGRVDAHLVKESFGAVRNGNENRLKLHLALIRRQFSDYTGGLK